MSLSALRRLAPITRSLHVPATNAPASSTGLGRRFQSTASSQTAADSSEPAGGLLLYTAGTPNGRKVAVLLEELKAAAGVQYFVRPISLRENEQKEPWFLALNPNGRIPVLRDVARGHTVFESAAILLYLETHYDKERLFGFDPVREEESYSEMLQWVFWAHGGLGPMSGQASHFRNAAPVEIPYAQKRYTEETERLYGVLELRLADRDHLAGPGKGKYSIADINAQPWVAGHKWAGIDSLDSWPGLKFARTYTSGAKYRRPKPGTSERPAYHAPDPLVNNPQAVVTSLEDDALTFIHRPPPSAPSPYSLSTAPSSPLLRPATPLTDAPLPPPIRPSAANKTLPPRASDATVAEIRRLRRSDPVNNSRTKLANRFGVTSNFVAGVAALKSVPRTNLIRARDAEHQKIRDNWSEKKATVRAIREKRREFW
ncbi:hypothetical protein DXG03_004873 [Asterophora parasitica]|uniref:GST N-terminal domain-containing protein n=1 Tax=Asterophora parasitica TaxID=117018 RepID=A0A9P7KI14_9AGAR|nr:hypothetical protein DXG03_004873 [Asterophora parasitica]